MGSSSSPAIEIASKRQTRLENPSEIGESGYFGKVAAPGM